LIRLAARKRRALKILADGFDAFGCIKSVHAIKVFDNIRRESQKQRNVRPVRLPQYFVPHAQRNRNVLADIFLEVRKLFLEVLDPLAVLEHGRAQFAARNQRRKILHVLVGVLGRAILALDRRPGVPGLLFHDFRRSSVRNMIRRGVPQKTARTVSGHKTDAVFSRYNIVSEDDIRDAARRIEEGAKAAVSDVIPTSFPLAPNEGNEGVASKDRKPS